MDEFLDLSVRGRKTRFREKDYAPDAVYHVFHRREDAAVVFRDDVDRGAFLDKAKRLLAPDHFRDVRGRSDTPLPGQLTLLAYCLLDNHFHLVLRQHDVAETISAFMQRLMTSYAMHFNRRHAATGPLFDQPYQSVPVESKRHLLRLIAYVHANPPAAFDYRWSSHALYVDPQPPANGTWCNSAAGLRAYGGRASYLEWFARAIEERKQRGAS